MKIDNLQKLNGKLFSNITIYGAGDTARHIIKYAKDRGVIIPCAFVSYSENNPDEIMGTPVRIMKQVSEEELKNTDVLICTTEKYTDEIKKYICKLPFKKISTLSDDVIKQVIFENRNYDENSIEIERKIYGGIEVQINRLLRFAVKPCLEYMIVNILDHCNLRCKGCDHFACIADEKFYHRKDIYKDLTRMSEIFHGDYILKIAVMGGEPLLHPELKQILADVRECFPYAIIRLTTNGLLLLQQDDEFWKVCREKDVTIVNTKYPLNLKYDDMQKKASEEGVKFQFFEGTGDGKIKHSFKKIINLKGDNNPAESFSRCHISNYGNILLDGKFYGCPFSVQSYRIFNKKFKQNLRMTEDDYIDIYKVDDKEEFFKFAARPKYYCRYCSGLSPEFPWERSRQDMSEWV